MQKFIEKIILAEFEIFIVIRKLRKHIFNVGIFENLRYHTHNYASAEVLNFKARFFQFFRIFGYYQIFSRAELDNYRAEQILRTDSSSFQFFKIHTLMQCVFVNKQNIAVLFNNYKRIENFSDNTKFNRFFNKSRFIGIVFCSKNRRIDGLLFRRLGNVGNRCCHGRCILLRFRLSFCRKAQIWGKKRRIVPKRFRRLFGGNRPFEKHFFQFFKFGSFFRRGRLLHFGLVFR